MTGGSVDYSAAAAASMAAIMMGGMLKVILVVQARDDFQVWSFDPKVTSLSSYPQTSAAMSELRPL
jgi:hypothetical protein